jgi:hypothetical protein
LDASSVGKKEEKNKKIHELQLRFSYRLFGMPAERSSFGALADITVTTSYRGTSLFGTVKFENPLGLCAKISLEYVPNLSVTMSGHFKPLSVGIEEEPTEPWQGRAELVCSRALLLPAPLILLDVRAARRCACRSCGDHAALAKCLLLGLVLDQP